MQVGAAAVAVTSSLAVGTIALSPSAIANYGAVTATTAVNIRTSPNTGSSILGVLHKGQRLTQVGAMKYGFVPVKFGSTTAYVAANYLAGAKSSDASTGTAAGAKGDVFTSEPLNVRSGPGIKYSVHATLAKGSKVERTGLVSGGFTQIFFSTGRAWVSTTYLSTAQPSGKAIATTGSVKASAGLMVRNQTGRGIAGLGEIPSGSVLPSTGNKAGYLTEVVWRGQRVWVTTAYIHKVGQVPTAAPEALPTEIGTRYATETVNVRSGPGTSHSTVASIPQGTAVKITGTVTSGFAQINFNGASRWVSAAYLSSTQGGSDGDSGGGNSGGGNSGGGNSGGSGPIDLTGSIGLNGLNSSTRNIVNVVASRFSVTTFYGVRPDSLPDHPSGHAVDIMLPKWNTAAGKAKGWDIANYLRENAASLNIQYLIFDQKIWNVSRDREGWRAMSDRGNSTANHKDHVHVTTKGL